MKAITVHHVVISLAVDFCERREKHNSEGAVKLGRLFMADHRALPLAPFVTVAREQTACGQRYLNLNSRRRRGFTCLDN